MIELLIVEDDASQARILARALCMRRSDLHVATAYNGAQAIEMLGERHFDLVLTDLQMPEMDGFELLAWIIRHRPAMPVFTMTGYGNENTFVRLSELGAIECFTKPLNVKIVLAHFGDALAQTITGHVRNVSLASFLQLIEAERKTCTLMVESSGDQGLLFMRKGELLDARAGELCGDAAAIAIVAWSNPGITILSTCATRERVIQNTLGFLIMEGLRVQDESARDHALASQGSRWETEVNEDDVRESAKIVLNDAQVKPAQNGSMLPGGARALAIVDTATGDIRSFASKADVPVHELARMAALVLRQEVATLASCGELGPIEELVLSTKMRCDVIRPFDSSAREFALFVFAPDETNLMMARFELDRFIASRG